MGEEKTITSLLKEKRVFNPPSALSERAWVKTMDQYKEICKKHEVDPMRYMGMSQTLSNSIWFNENKNFVEDIKELFPVKVSTTFKGYKA